MKFLATLSALIAAVLDAIARIRFERGVRKVEDEIKSKDDNQTKTELENIL